MKIEDIITIILTTIIIICLAIFVEEFALNPTAQTISNADYETQNNYSYTYTAICNSTNFCQDYEISCEGNDAIKTSSITGAFIQHEKDWKDPREKEANLC